MQPLLSTARERRWPTTERLTCTTQTKHGLWKGLPASLASDWMVWDLLLSEFAWTSSTCHRGKIEIVAKFQTRMF